MRGRGAALVLTASVAGVFGIAIWRGLGDRGERAALHHRPEILPRGPRPARTEPTAPTPAVASTLSVEVVDEGAAPVRGVDGLLTGEDPVGVVEATDAAGIAVFSGRTERELDVWIVVPDGGGARLRAGRFLPGQGDARLRFVLRPARRIELLVRCDGARRLPDTWWVGEPVLFDVVADPERGTLRGRFHPTRADRRVRVLFHVPGCLDGGADLVLPLEGDPVVATIDLATPIALIVSGPRDPDLLRQVRMEHQDPGGSGWHDVPTCGLEWADDGSFVSTYRVAPGRCRLVLSTSGAIVAENEVRAGDGDRRLALDLEGADWCDVRVRVPDGIDPAYIRLAVEGDRVSGRAPEPMGSRGEYRLLVPVGRSLTVRAHHPLLASARGATGAALTPRGRVVLEMEHALLLRFRFPGIGGIVADVTLRTHAGAPPVFRGDAVQADLDGSLGVAGFEPGTYLVTVDPQEAVPVTVRAHLEPAGTHLGDLPYERGSAIRVVRRGAREIRVIATSDGVVRRAEGHGGIATVRGLAAKVWRLAIAVGDLEFRREVAVDGVTDAVVTLDEGE